MWRDTDLNASVLNRSEIRAVGFECLVFAYVQLALSVIRD